MAPSALTKLKRALKAAVAAGFPATRAEIEDGKTKIVLIFGGTDAQETSEPTPLDAWRASRVTTLVAGTRDVAALRLLAEEVA